MSDILTEIEDTSAKALQNHSQIPVELIREYVVKISEVLIQVHGIKTGLSEAELDLITKRLQERFDIIMPLGTLFAAEDYRPWLDENRGGIDWYYWERYKRSLNYAPNVIQSLDNITDQILDHLENPLKSGSWQRKGMVVGHVQSGKTANYIGLACKAADSGYKVIIILAGMLNTLRNQTQLRLDNGFLGINTQSKKATGVGLIDNKRRPAYFTTNIEDFKKNIANQVGVGLATLNEPALLVIKKNKSTLENLNDWLVHNNPHNLQEYPMLLIDDEADLASINTKKESEEATAINQGIRQLIRLFSRSSYVGYTATPFANVFIDPETDDDMLGDDLEDWMAESSMLRRTFRQVAVIAGLIDQRPDDLQARFTAGRKHEHSGRLGSSSIHRSLSFSQVLGNAVRYGPCRLPCHKRMLTYLVTV